MQAHLGAHWLHRIIEVITRYHSCKSFSQHIGRAHHFSPFGTARTYLPPIGLWGWATEPSSSLLAGPLAQAALAVMSGCHLARPSVSPVQAIDPHFPPPTPEAASDITLTQGFDVLIDTPTGRNMRKTISGSGRGAYNSTMAAAVRAMRKTSSSNGSNTSQEDTVALDRINSTSSTGPGVMTRSASGSADESDSSPVALQTITSLQRDTSLQRSNKGNTISSMNPAIGNAASADAADAAKAGLGLTKQLLKTNSVNNAAAVYGQNLVTRTMRSTNSGPLGVHRAAFRV